MEVAFAARRQHWFGRRRWRRRNRFGGEFGGWCLGDQRALFLRCPARLTLLGALRVLCCYMQSGIVSPLVLSPPFVTGANFFDMPVAFAILSLCRKRPSFARTHLIR